MNTLEARRRLLGRNVYKRNTEGNPAIAQGSLARRYPGITMQGWTEQDSTTGAQLYDQSLAEDNKYQNFDINSNDFLISPSDEFWITGKIPVKPNTTYTMNVNVFGAYYSDADIPITTTIKEENPFTTPENANYVCLNIKKSNYPFGSDIMLNEGTTALPYEPYTGGQPSPSPDYPQEIVNAGKYNEEAQKWEYKITIANEQTDPDKEQTVTLTSDRPLTKWDRLEKRNDQWGWVYKSAEVVLDGSVDENWLRQSDSNEKKQFYILLSDALYPYSDPFKEMFYCDTFLTTNNLGAIPKWQVRKGTYKGLAPVFKPSDDIDTVEAFRNFLAENQTTILYVTKEETFIPLSESEQEQMNALHTYYPTTVLSNDCGCNMTLTYKTKKSLEVAT